MTNMLVIIIGLLVYNYSFLFYTRFHSSSVEHGNLWSKVVVMGHHITTTFDHKFSCSTEDEWNLV